MHMRAISNDFDSEHAFIRLLGIEAPISGSVDFIFQQFANLNFGSLCFVYRSVTEFFIFQEPTEFAVMWQGYRTVWMRYASAALILCMYIILYLYRKADVNTGPPRVGSIITSRCVVSFF